MFAKAQLRANFAANVPAGCAPVAVQFADSTSGNSTQWLWSFGNGDTSQLQNPAEVFTKAGNYTVKLIVSNNNYTDSISKIITIWGSVKAGFTYSYDNVCAAPSSFSFTANNPQDTISYNWNFGNGKTAMGANSSTIFLSNGSYNVSLVTVTPQGCRDTSIQTFAVGSPKASFSSYSVICAHQSVLCTNTSLPVPLSVKWYNEDIFVSKTRDQLFGFAGAYSSTVKMIANFGSCSDTATKIITAKEKPVPGFTQSGNLQSCTLPTTISFTNNSSNATSYNWLFGDGNSSAQTNISYTYNKAGVFSVSLIAFNGDGCSDTLTKTNLIRLGPPVISNFTALPTSGCVPENISSGANITSPDSVATYDWNTGDNNLHVSGSQFNHSYNNDGYYNVTLNVTTKNGCTGSFNLHQAVAAGTKPVADFTVDKSSVCASTPVQFIDKSVGNVTSWNWNLGDGTSTSGTNNPTHTFTKVGSNDVTLYESNKGCAADPKTIKNIVTILPPIAKFGVSYNCSNPLQVSFTDSSVQPTNWLWNFTDGSTSTIQNPTYTFAASGTYNVILTSSNTNTACSSSDTQTVVVTDVKTNIIAQPNSSFICRNDSIRLSAVNNSGFIVNYSWDVGDGSPALNDSTVSHSYKTSGIYYPFVSVQYINKCKDTVYTNQPVNVYGPTASFTASQGSNCIPADVTFTDNSATDNIHAIVSTTWLYGNGETDTISSNTHVHIYVTGGSFIPGIIIKDASGCTDSFVSPKQIVAKGAVAGFTYSVSPSCDSARASFTDTSKVYNDVIASYSWSLDNGNNASSSLQNPTYTYHSSGTYKITQTVTTQSGCSSTSTQNLYVLISPKPAINVTGPIEGCVASGVPLSANIAVNSAVQQWNWNLGNGSNANGQRITAVYDQPGTYNIIIVAALEGGCNDTSYQKLIINDIPKINAGNDSFVCAGSGIVLQASGANIFTWQDVNNSLSCTDCTSPVATPTASTHYVVTGTNAAGCSSTDSVFIKVQQKQTLAVTSANLSVCAGNNVQLSASGTDEYSWQPSQNISNISAANPIVSPTTTTVYTVTGTDNKHCFTDTKQVTVTVSPLPQFNIVDSVITISRGTKQTIQTTSSPDVIQWLWKPATGLSCSDCAQPQITATINAVYTATAYTANGCSDSEEVKVLLLCDQSGIFIPTAFTPNGDGKNDFFYPMSFASSKVISFTVFSRNGMVVFQRQNTFTNANKEGWDGTYQSMQMPADTYVYKIEVECEKEVIPYVGTVVLVR